MRHLADGTDVSVAEYEENVGQKLPGITRVAQQVRPDGTVVLAQARNYLPIPGDGSPDGAVRSTIPLSADQLVALVSDPAYQV